MAQLELLAKNSSCRVDPRLTDANAYRPIIKPVPSNIGHFERTQNFRQILKAILCRRFAGDTPSGTALAGYPQDKNTTLTLNGPPR